MPVTATAGSPGEIDPETLYSLRGFIEASGISYTRIVEARRASVELRMLRVGKRKFVRGSDGIAFVERLAEQTAAKQGDAA